MKNERFHILSTKILDEALVDLVSDRVQLDSIPFIETYAVPPAEIAQQLAAVPIKNGLAIFTSVNAVNAVAAAGMLQPGWSIACIEPTTKKRMQEAFPQSAIVATAPTAAALAEQIVRIAPENCIFFCGNKRLGIIPSALKKKGIPYREIMVYNTIKTPQVINKEYDGIIFYSPSGVESFFELNKIPATVKAYSIGPSTTKALQQYTENIVQSKVPDTKQMIAWISNSI
ncbi:uroporphyrinogen III synthase HEM4 [Niabella ginsenosidivorans]|uniref:Uroporphyrinogen III synthase HEM4 n=1 Tax=Niabella ginsenosidivorans TaxID=1176587 RepID=A0A1A9I7D5_9BACT|nr:uroporphyrinogen-III synthase [Niabella ginsenosidivorans]ANH83493.1 uroporphyrinogen III synthase HEM4 [Niabella ginsenosidivorans]